MSAMSGKVHRLLLFFVLCAACSARSLQAEPTETAAPTPTATPVKIPLTEAEVPRVSVSDAKAALDDGTAVMVDVRSPAAFQASHVTGAINIQLGEIETNATALPLAKERWIITYCT